MANFFHRPPACAGRSVLAKTGGWPCEKKAMKAFVFLFAVTTVFHRFVCGTNPAGLLQQGLTPRTNYKCKNASR
jgi:hypothetical protein